MTHSLEPRRPRSLFASIGMIIVAVIVLNGALATVLYTRCVSTFQESLFAYPGGQQIEASSAILGEQRVVYITDDDRETVLAWLAARDTALMREAVLSGNFSGTTPGYQVFASARPEGGTQIDIWRNCP